MDLSVHVGKATIKPVSVACDLGVLLDEEMTMNQHISNSMRAEHNREQTDLWAMDTCLSLNFGVTVYPRLRPSGIKRSIKQDCLSVVSCAN